MTGNTRKRTFGLAAILVVGTIAGFLVAAGTSGAEYATVGTISDDEAFQMPVEEEDQRVRFALSADQATAEQPAASFALYDPADRFFTEFELAGDGDDAEVILDDVGPWVLFVTDRRNAELAIQYEAGNSEDVQLEEIPVVDEKTVVAEQGGGALDEQVVFRTDQRPASVLLEYTGEIEDMDATVASDEGPVYELVDASADNSGETTSRAGDVTFTSANLAAGTYDVQASADAFEGELVFVERTFERQAATEPVPDEREEAVENVTPYAEANEGEIVAELEQGQAYEIDTADVSELAFLADRDTQAQLILYNASDQVVDQIEVETDTETTTEENESQPQHNETVHTSELPASGTYVVYAEYVYPQDETVSAFVPSQAASPAQQLDVETQEATLQGTEDSWNTTIEDGALVGVSVGTQDLMGSDRNVTVTGEQGPVLHYQEAGNVLGASANPTYEEYPERFTGGEIDVDTGGQALAGQTHVQLIHYVR